LSRRTWSAQRSLWRSAWRAGAAAGSETLLVRWQAKLLCQADRVEGHGSRDNETPLVAAARAATAREPDGLMRAERRRPVIGVLCCNEVNDRPVQVAASRFVEPLSRISDATVVLIPAIAHASDVAGIASLLDGLLLTGSRSHVAPNRYGDPSDDAELPLDRDRDEVALSLAGGMIEAGRPVFGICRGLQEINVLFGGSLSSERCLGRHHLGAAAADFAALFDHRHEVELAEDGRLAAALGTRRLTVNSVHEQAIERVGCGLRVEAIATDDRIVEAISAHPCGADVLAVQWHPEWDVATCAASRRFFEHIGRSVRGGG
jgi:putative glutamine amidotransferase